MLDSELTILNPLSPDMIWIFSDCGTTQHVQSVSPLCALARHMSCGPRPTPPAVSTCTACGPGVWHTSLFADNRFGCVTASLSFPDADSIFFSSFLTNLVYQQQPQHLSSPGPVTCMGTLLFPACSSDTSVSCPPLPPPSMLALALDHRLPCTCST